MIDIKSEKIEEQDSKIGVYQLPDRPNKEIDTQKFQTFKNQYLETYQNLIYMLLIFPNQAVRIFAANQKLLNADLLGMMEQAVKRMSDNGSTEAAAFLQDLAAQLKQKIATEKLQTLKEQNLETYQNLIYMLLISPNQADRILQANNKLIDAGLVQMMEEVAMRMAANGSTEAAAFLQDLTARLKRAIATPLGLVDPHQELLSSKTEGKRATKLKLWWSGTILLLVGCAIMLTSQKRGVNFAKASPQSDDVPQTQALTSGSILPVKTLHIEPVDSYQVSRAYTGTVAASRISELGFERSGKLIEIAVDQGSRVVKGMPLAYLDNKNLQAQERELLAERAQALAQLKELQAGPRSETIAAAQASVRDLQHQLELARNRSARRQALYTEGAISREEFEDADINQSVLQARLDEAQSNLDELLAGTRSEQIEAQQASIEQLDANLANLRIDLEKSSLKAPFNGTISARQVDEGTVVSSGQSILRLVEDGPLEVRIGIPVAAANRLKQGSTLPVKIAQKIYQARVVSILPELDSSTRTLTVVLTLEPRSAGIVSPGQVARLQLTENIATSGYWLPTTALVRGKRGLWSIYVLGQPHPEKSLLKEGAQLFPVEKRDVEVLHTEGDRVLVRGTLQKGNQIIVNGNHRLVPGQLVKVQ